MLQSEAVLGVLVAELQRNITEYILDYSELSKYEELMRKKPSTYSNGVKFSRLQCSDT